jgi:hypothetical protein
MAQHTTAEQAEITKLERRWPAYQVWVVNRVIGGAVWAARRWDDGDSAMRTINAATPAMLDTYIGQAEAEREAQAQAEDGHQAAD